MNTINDWVTHHWYKASNHRYYRVELHQDLFGQWMLTCTWGSALKLGRQTETPLDSLEHGYHLLQSIGRVRQRRQYRRIMDRKCTAEIKP
jgi:hypothetical protein